jgi:hypothetical protein
LCYSIAELFENNKEASKTLDWTSNYYKLDEKPTIKYFNDLFPSKKFLTKKISKFLINKNFHPLDLINEFINEENVKEIDKKLTFFQKYTRIPSFYYQIETFFHFQYTKLLEYSKNEFNVPLTKTKEEDELLKNNIKAVLLAIYINDKLFPEIKKEIIRKHPEVDDKYNVYYHQLYNYYRLYQNKDIILFIVILFLFTMFLIYITFYEKIELEKVKSVKSVKRRSKTKSKPRSKPRRRSIKR